MTGQTVCVDDLMALYSGGMKIADIAKACGISAGKTYYLLRDAGCVFRKKAFTHHTDETRRRMSEARKGVKFSEEWCKHIGDARRCHFNGLNGYGHTKKHNGGYILTYAPDHPNAHKDGYVMLHTVLMERQLGRYLKPTETVHHINHIRDDNRISNLQLMEKHEHFSMHMKERNAQRRYDLSTV